MPESKYRLLLIRHYLTTEAFKAEFGFAPGDESTWPKERLVMNYQSVAPALEGVDWDFHPGAPITHGPGTPETREELAIVGINRLPIVREACESGKYNGLVLLGGVDPGFWESVEIARPYGIAVTANAHAQMHLASMLGARFSVLDISEGQSVRMGDLIVQYGFADRCASMRMIDYPLPRRPFDYGRSITEERTKFAAGQPTPILDAMMEQAVAAIEEDGAEVLMLGCSASYFLRDPLEERLRAEGWNVPVLEGYRPAIAMAKMMIDAGQVASGITFPGPLPKRWRRRKFV